MTARTFFCLALWLGACLGGRALARGGGGCLEAGTLVLTPRGPVAVEQLTPGDTVLAWVAGELRAAVVQARTEVRPRVYLELDLDGRVLRVTPEHPVALAPEPGVFRSASELRAGDALWRWDGRKLVAATLRSVREVRAERPAYDLLVSPGGNFLANGLLVHNKGCFLPDAPILRADGSQVAIREVKPGDRLMAFTSAGALTTATVREVLTHQVDGYLLVKTAGLEMRVTAEHPFFVGHGTFRTVEALKPGDRVFVYDARGLRAEPILSIARVQGRTTVYNLRTDAPNTFFAWGVAVHNKGGGCLEAGTPVLTPRGAVAVERLAPGDAVLAWSGGRLRPAEVQASLRVEPREYLELALDSGLLRVTSEHPLAVGPEMGLFRAAGELGPGDVLWRSDGERLVPARLRSVRWVKADRPAFDLMVSPGGNFLAGGLLVHNKGCFLPDAPILRADGSQVAIREVKPGQKLMAYTASGAMTTAVVREVLTHQVEEYLLVKTTTVELRVTAEHPFFVGHGTFRTLEVLRPGDRVFVYDGRGMRQEPILSIAPVQGRTVVYNLRTDGPNTFFAWGVAVHNKGGGGSHGGGSHGGGGSGGDGAMVFLFFIGLFVFIVVAGAIAKKEHTDDEDLDFCYTSADISRKSVKTGRLLEFIAKQDAAFNRDELVKAATATFLKLQECWEKREYGPMQPLLMADLYGQHLAQIKGLARNHEINVIADLKVERVDIVNVRYTNQPEQREFTALFTARAKDYYLDDRTREVLRGDEAPARFQEFWTFQLQAGRWLLREIEQTRESDALKDENFFEPFTEEGLKGIYAGKGGEGGPIGPWLEKETGRKADRIERMLGFLAQTDKLWNRQAMLERARQVFLRVYLAWESGDPAQAPAADLFPNTAAHLQEGIRRQKAEGVAIQFRNLCVRKAELVLVRNFADNSRDEFVVRISAHAQRIHTRQGQTVLRDEYVTPFEQYWTFGRLDGQWRLKEVLPAARGPELVARENLDQDSSAEQLQWYYRQPRAT